MIWAVNFVNVRPLATIEPAAIEYGLPVNTHFGFRDITGLQQELTKPIYESATIFVAWEHIYLDDFVRALGEVVRRRRFAYSRDGKEMITTAFSLSGLRMEKERPRRPFLVMLKG